MFLDAHIHIQNIDDKELFFREAKKSNVERFFVNGTREDDWERVARLEETCSGVVPWFGVHPWFVDGVTATWEERLRKYLCEKKGAHIGEIGLDSVHSKKTLDQQVLIFKKQIDLAIELKRSFSLHCVGAWGMTIDILRAYKDALPPFICHAYGGSQDVARSMTRLGGYISFSTSLTRRAPGKTRDLLRAIAPERLLVETDYPYISKATGSDTRYGDLIQALYCHIADMRGETLETIERVVWKNGEIFTN
jgi:TatD DNase family protein